MTNQKILCWEHLEVYTKPCQIFKKKCFAKIINGFLPLSIFAKRSILDIWEGSEYAPGTVSTSK